MMLSVAVGLAAIHSVNAAAIRTSHPFHSTQAEIEWNSQTERFEVALSLWPVDVETVLKNDAELRKTHAGLVDLDSEELHELLDPALERYVRQGFALTVQMPAGAERVVGDDPVPKRFVPVSLEWLGFEVERDSIWCYFELVPEAGLLPKVAQRSRDDRSSRDDRTQPRDEPSGNEEPESESTTDATSDTDNESSELGLNQLGLRFRNELFFELQPDQENVILLKIAGRRHTLRSAVDVRPETFAWPVGLESVEQ